MKYDLNYGDKKSIRYQFIKELYSRYQLQGYTQGFAGSSAQGYTQAHDLQGFARSSAQGQSQGFTGSGLRSYANGESYREYSQQYIFLPSDPDELVDQLKLLYFEKVGGNDNPQLNKQVIAIVDKLLEYESISPSQHQNIISSIT